MSAKIIKLYSGPTAAQLRRVRAWAHDELSSPTCPDDRSLCQDIAHLACQIDLAGFLFGAIKPSANKEGIGSDIDRELRKLYKGAEAVMFKAMDGYPETQGLARKRRKCRAGRKAQSLGKG